MNTAPLHAELASLRELVVTLKQALEHSEQENNLLRQWPVIMIHATEHVASTA